MLESELVKRIESYILKHRIRYATEVRMGIGVPDISINIGASRRIPLITDYFLFSIIEYIENEKKVTISDISNKFSFDKNRTQSYLKQLLDEGVAIQYEDFIAINRKIFGLNLGKTISIEAKIKDWKSGILQAERYLMFSDYSYLALPEDKIHNVDMAQLEKTGIGLLSVKDNNNLEEIVKPILSQECDYKQKYLATVSIISNSYNVSNRINDNIFHIL